MQPGAAALSARPCATPAPDTLTLAATISYAPAPTAARGVPPAASPATHASPSPRRSAWPCGGRPPAR